MYVCLWMHLLCVVFVCLSVCLSVCITLVRQGDNVPSFGLDQSAVLGLRSL